MIQVLTAVHAVQLGWKGVFGTMPGDSDSDKRSPRGWDLLQRAR